MKTLEQQRARQAEVHNQIATELKGLSRKYDAKELAVVMFCYATELFRAVHSLGMWPVKDVEIFTTNVMQDLLTPLPKDQLPQQAIIDENGVINPTTSQRLS